MFRGWNSGLYCVSGENILTTASNNIFSGSYQIYYLFKCYLDMKYGNFPRFDEHMKNIATKFMYGYQT